jgi:flavin reductase (DIM6/NTAB) family NADH-FMN oxidoreductase RutF
MGRIAFAWVSADAVGAGGSAPAAFDAGTFRRALGRFPTGVTLVTAADASGPLGLLVNAFTSVSLEPPLLAVSLSESGVPRICSAIAFLDCEPVTEQLAGDHWIVDARVHELLADHPGAARVQPGRWGASSALRGTSHERSRRERCCHDSGGRSRSPQRGLSPSSTSTPPSLMHGFVLSDCLQRRRQSAAPGPRNKRDPRMSEPEPAHMTVRDGSRDNARSARL